MDREERPEGQPRLRWHVVYYFEDGRGEQRRGPYGFDEACMEQRNAEHLGATYAYTAPSYETTVEHTVPTRPTF